MQRLRSPFRLRPSAGAEQRKGKSRNSPALGRGGGDEQQADSRDDERRAGVAQPAQAAPEDAASERTTGSGEVPGHKP